MLSWEKRYGDKTMSDKPDLFQKLFRKTKDNLDKKQTPAQPNPKPPLPGGQPPRSASQSQAKSERKIKIPLTGGKLETYKTCPRRFQYQYLDKKPSSRGASHYLSFDHSLHQTLKLFYQSYSGKEQLRLDKLLGLLETCWDNRGYENPEEEREFKIAAERGLRGYFQRHCQVPPRAAEIDYFFKVDLFGCEYSGKIDRLDRYPDGSLEIVDYKSGKPPAGGLAEMESTLSLQLLFLAADIIWPGKVKKISFHYIKDGTILTVLRNISLMAEAKKAYLDIGESIYQNRFPPVRSQGCEFCDYQDICPVGQILFLSSTKVKTYLECPQKYAATYVQRSAKKGPAEPSFELIFDRALHDALAAFYRDFKSAIHGDPMGFLLTAFFQTIPAGIPEDLTELIKATGRETLNTFFVNLYQVPRKPQVNVPLSVLTDQFEFQTTIDRIDQDETGGLTLVDYKSGKRVVDSGAIKLDPITAAVCFAAAAKWPGKVTALQHVFLRSGQVETVPIDDFLIERGKTLLEDISRKIKDQQFEAVPGYSCQRCAHQNACQRDSLSISASKLQTLRDCPKKYKFQYIDRLPAPEGDKPYLLLSQAVHDSLRFFFSQTRPPALPALLADFHKRLPPADDAVKQQILEKGTLCLTNLFNDLGGTWPRIKTLSERGRAHFEGVILNAAFDRVDILPSGKLEVTDYKTSKKAPTVNEKERDLSGILTYLAADGTWPGKIEKVTFHYLVPGEKQFYTPTDFDIERAKLAISEFTEEIAAGTFEGNRNPLCPYCDYQDRCEDAHRLLLSPSKISSFQSCPLKYKMNYIDRVPKEPRPTPSLSFDRSIHYALKEFHQLFDKKTSPKNPFPYLLGKYWNDAGYVDHEEGQRFRARALAYLEEYFNTLTGQEKPVMLETSAVWKLETLDLTVQIDRIDELPDGKLEIIDYKTGKKIPDARVIHEDKTLLNMFLAANQRWPGQVAKASYYFLANNTKLSVTPTAEQITQHTGKILEIVDDINKGNYEPHKGALCNFCEFYGPCPEWKVKPFMMANEPMDVFRKRMRLSYSKMGLFENCPRAYRKLYLDRVPPKPQPFFSFGTCIHETFEEIYDPAKPVKRPSFEEVMETYAHVWKKHREGYRDEATEERYKADGRRQLTMYFKRFIEDKEFQTAHSIEDYFEIPIGKYAVMTGFIDRIDKLPDDTYEILDYKTEPTNRTQEEVDKDKQLSIYYWACETTLGLKISKLSLFMLDHDCKITTTRKSEDVQKVVEHVDKIAYRMIHEQEFHPRKNKYCKSCDHLQDCPLKEEILNDEKLISMGKF